MNNVEEKWFSYVTEHPDAKINLFCFPHAGSGPGVYAYWGRLLSNKFNFYPIHYPMRERRKSEPLPDSIQELAYLLAKDNKELFLEKPFAFYGHCMGGIIAYETAKSLETVYGIGPALTVISSSVAPDCPIEHQIDEKMDIKKMAEIFADMHYISKDLIEDDMYVKYFIPVLKADYLLQQKYIVTEIKQLNSPIFVMYGDSDEQIAREKLLRWQRFSTVKVSYRPIPGGHFFVNKDNASAILETVQNKILESITAKGEKHGRSDGVK